MTEPLGLPRGSVRGIIVLALIVATVTVAIFASEAMAGGFLGLLGVSVRDYYSHREQENRRAGALLPEPEA